MINDFKFNNDLSFLPEGDNFKNLDELSLIRLNWMMEIVKKLVRVYYIIIQHTTLLMKTLILKGYYL